LEADSAEKRLNLRGRFPHSAPKRTKSENSYGFFEIFSSDFYKPLAIFQKKIYNKRKIFKEFFYALSNNEGNVQKGL